MKVELVSFDLWKTLIRANPAYVDQRCQLIAECIGWHGDPDTMLKAVNLAYRELGKITEVNGQQFDLGDWVGHAAATLDLAVPSAEQLTKLQADVITAHLEHLPFLTEDDLPETFRRHREAGRRIAIISNTSMTRGATLSLVLGALGLQQYIGYELYSDECGYAKPDPRIYQDLVALSATDPSSILHVGDNRVTDYEGPLLAGFHALQYTPKTDEVTPSTFRRHSELLTHPLLAA